MRQLRQVTFFMGIGQIANEASSRNSRINFGDASKHDVSERQGRTPATTLYRRKAIGTQIKQ